MSAKQVVSAPVHFPIRLSHLDREQTIAEAKKIVLQLRPQWKSKENATDENANESLNCQYFTEGITNTILSVWSKVAGPDDRVLLRIYGEKTELVIDRTAEKKNMVLLNRHGCAAPLYGTFENGVIYGFVPGRVLNRNDVREPHFSELIAKSMAKMHTVGFGVDGKQNLSNSDKSTTPMLIPKITSFIASLPTSFDNPAKQRKFETQFPPKDELLSELASITTKVAAMKSPVVFCHNDLLVKNLVYDQKQDDMKFIDYEYAAFNFQAYDIGNHFDEYAGVEDPDFSLYPDEGRQRIWLKQYLRYWREFTKGPVPTDRDVDVLYVQSNVFAATAHFFWSVWAVIQARYSTIDFDFLQYGIDRMNEYKRLKSRYWNLTSEKP